MATPVEAHDLYLIVRVRTSAPKHQHYGIAARVARRLQLSHDVEVYLRPAPASQGKIARMCERTYHVVPFMGASGS